MNGSRLRERSTSGSGADVDDDWSSAVSAANGNRLQRKLRDVIAKGVATGTLIPDMRILWAIAVGLSSLSAALAIAMAVYVYVLMGLR
jgi:hypothetical protein